MAQDRRLYKAKVKQMSEFFKKILHGKARKRPAKRHVKRYHIKVIRLHVPGFRKQHTRTYYKSKAEDARLKALKPGRRPAVKGKRKTYYEYRVNRADLSRIRRL